MDHASEGARETVRAVVEADPWATLEELRVAGERKAKAEAQAAHLENMRKVVLARLAGEIAQVQSNKSLSEAKLERLARSDPRYETHLRGLAAAKEEADLASADYWRIRGELLWMEKTIAHMNAMSRLQEPG